MTVEIDETKCGSCGKSVVDGRTVRTFQDGKVIAVTCVECDMAERIKLYEETGHMTTWLLTEACLGAYDRQKYESRCNPTGTPFERINASSARIQEAAKRFEEEVWFGGLKPIVKACPIRGMKAAPLKTPFGDVTAMLWVCAGRCMFTLDAPKCDVTVITAEDDGDRRCMGVQGLHATEAEAVGMLDAVTGAWKDGALTFVGDENVGI